MIPTKLVVHCSASPQGRGDNAEVIHRWHREQGWAGCGYHWIILEDGTYEAGRPEYWKGAHVRGHNKKSLGVCLIGQSGDFTEAQYRALRVFIETRLEKYPGMAIYGHGDLDENKSRCPGFDVGAWFAGDDQV